MNVQPPLPADDIGHVLRLAEKSLCDLRDTRIFLTGATGFFGRWLLESLLAADRRWGLGLHITALSRDPAKFFASVPHLAPARNLTWMCGSVASLDLSAWGNRPIDILIHLATEADMQAVRTDPAGAIDVIQGGTQRILALARAVDAKRCLFTSSGAVYGRQPAGVEQMDEVFSGQPDLADSSDPYALAGEAKRQAELLCVASARQGLAVVIARGFTFAGPALPLDGKFAFGNFVRDALERRPITVTGDGTPVRSYLYAADLAVWLWTILLRGVPGRAYNVGSERAITLRALADAVAIELGAPGVQVLSPPVASPHRYVPSTRRAVEEMALAENFDLSEMIRRTASWHRALLQH